MGTCFQESCFHEQVRAARNRQGITQQALAEALGVTQAVVAAWERGRLPDLYHLSKLCRELDVSADYLLGLQGDNHGGGLTWTISMPRSDTFYYNPILKEGVELFSQIVQEGITTERAEPTNRGPAMLRLLLRSILVNGVVRIIDVDRDAELEKKVKNKFSLDQNRDSCIVAKLDIPSDRIIDPSIRNEAVSFLAARDATRSLDMELSCGLMGGVVISRWADLLQPRFQKVQWISMVKTAGTEAPVGNTANALVARLAYTQGSRALRMPFIDANRRQKSYHEMPEGHEKDELKGAMDVLRRVKDLEVAFMSVGCCDNYSQPGHEHPLARVLHNMMPGDKKRVVGDVLLRLVDIDGNLAGTDKDQALNDAVVYSISLDDLKDIVRRGHVWILAGVPAKADCVRAALTAKLANSLVIDSSVANALLEGNSESSDSTSCRGG